MKVREVLKVLKADGWTIKAQRGSHIQLTHPVKPGKVTVPNHAGEVENSILKSILTQAGLR